jgi:hypothetical protein
VPPDPNDLAPFGCNVVPPDPNDLAPFSPGAVFFEPTNSENS